MLLMALSEKTMLIKKMMYKLKRKYPGKLAVFSFFIVVHL
jgi:hypothetical protein